MKNLIKAILTGCLIFVIAGTFNHIMKKNQTESVEWRDVGVGARETVDGAKDMVDDIKDSRIINDIKEGFQSKDSLNGI